MKPNEMFRYSLGRKENIRRLSGLMPFEGLLISNAVPSPIWKCSLSSWGVLGVRLVNPDTVYATPRARLAHAILRIWLNGFSVYDSWCIFVVEALALCCRHPPWHICNKRKAKPMWEKTVVRNTITVIEYLCTSYPPIVAFLLCLNTR